MINQFDPNERDMLSKIQGNILKGHGREHTANIFIKAKNGHKRKVKTWLNELVDDTTGIIKSGYKQLHDNYLWKTQKINGGIFSCIHISADGLNYLFEESEKIDLKELFKDHNSFLLGLKENKDLNDPKVNQWEETFQKKIHFHLLIGDNDKNNVKEYVETIKEDIKEFADIVGIEFGDAIKNAEGAGIEHFGYVDGISQPLFFDEELDKFKKQHSVKNLIYDPSAEPSQVLFSDPFGFGGHASFFVFRKLEQNVRGFKEAEKKLARNLNLHGEDVERAGAMLIGRFEDGTPVEVSDEPGIIGNNIFNNFDYKLGDISKCPFHSHIRKTNPRNDLNDSKNAVMARRGIPYGNRKDDPNDGKIDNKPTRGVGLLFQSYQANIENQFERIQKFWANDINFNSPETGLDLIIGQGNYPSKNLYNSEWGNSDTLKVANFDQFVTMKGGEYFFAPSIPFLKTV
jgi:Dyp-type peroxidase family